MRTFNFFVLCSKYRHYGQALSKPLCAHRIDHMRALPSPAKYQLLNFWLIPISFKMRFQLMDINPDVDFPALARCLLEAYENPKQRFLHLFFPINGPGPEAREAAVQVASERLKLWHTQNPSSHWHKMIEVKTGKIVAGASWRIYKTNPFSNPHPTKATWFPDDNSRKFVEQALENLDRPRYRVAQRPHLYYRRMGIGQHILDWGIKKAEELALDFFLNATLIGKPLYEANDFICVEKSITAPKMVNPDEKWKEIEAKVGPIVFWLMWRPIGGNDNEGTVVNHRETAAN